MATGQLERNAMVILAATAGGAAAAAIDVKTPTRMPAGISIGAWTSAAAVAVGLVLSGAYKNKTEDSKLADALIDGGTGGLAYSVGAATSAYMLKSAAAAAQTTQLPAGQQVSGLPGQRVSAANASVRAHLSRMRAAA